MTDSSSTVETTVPSVPLTPARADNDNNSSSRTTPLASKASLRKLMVSCIDSALEELGPIGDISQEQLKRSSQLPVTSVLPDLTSNKKEASKIPANSAPSSTPTAADLYGYGAASPEPRKACPEMRGRMRRPRYQRRNSVTKFSLSNALKQVQQEEREGNLKVHQHQQPMSMLMMKRMPMTAASMTTPSRQLWEKLYANLEERPMKRSVLALGTAMPSLTAMDLPAAKRRRGSAA